VIQRTSGMHILVLGQRLATQRGEGYQLVMVKDISEIYEEVTRQAGFPP